MLPTPVTENAPVFPIDTNSFLKFSSVKNFRLYPDNEESERLNLRLLFLVTKILGFISEISCEDPPVPAILTVVGGTTVESMRVWHRDILLSSTL